MQTVNTVAALREQINAWRSLGERIALVPTMGNLHQGHLQLVSKAKHQAERVVVSIFVNPMQFTGLGGGDFERYPRTLAADSDKLREAGADLLFAPAVEEMYPGGFDKVTRVEVPGISDILCGEFRPGHFVGVATVVAKLFNMAQPDVALFGSKDFQQLLIIRRMANELCFPLQIIGVPTVREASGLAMSSRNHYLTEAERQEASLLYQVLCEVKERVIAGGERLDAIEAAASAELAEAGFRPDYLTVRRAGDLQSPTAEDRELVVLVAAWLGSARLIDNIPFSR